MKKAFLFLILLLSFFGHSQKTINLKYDHPTDRETYLSNQLNDIITFSLTCKDKNAQGKTFLIKRQEILKGEIVDTDSLISCEKKVYQVFTKNDTLQYKVNPCNQVKFRKEEKEYKIIFGGKFKNDSIKTIVNYPKLSLTSFLKADNDYVFQNLQKTDTNYNFRIEIGKDYPIIALTPPFKSKGAYASYCLLNGQEPMNFYNEFDIERYYIYYLKIE